MSIVVASSLKCTANDPKAKITNSLNKFLNGASGALGDAYDMVAGLDTAVSEISDSMSIITTGMSTLLEEKLVSFVDTGLQAAKNFIMNKITSFIGGRAQTNAFINAATKPVNGLFKAFGCLGSVIKNALKGTIKNLLLNMIKKGVLNPLECAVEDFMSALTTKITNMMDGIITPLIAPIEKLFSIVGGAFGSIKGFLAGGLNILGKIQGLLNCKGGGGNCHIVEEYDLNGQVKDKKSNAEKQNGIVKIFKGVAEGIESANEGVDKLTKDVGNWGLFAGRNKITKESELKRVNEEISIVKSAQNSINEKINERDKKIAELTSSLKFEVSLLKNYQKDLKVQLNIEKRNNTNNPNNPLVFSNLGSSDILKEQIKKIENKIAPIEKELINLKRENIQFKGEINKLNGNIESSNKEITQLNTLDDGGIIRSNENEFTKELLAGEPNCNTGNIFDCGLPRVKFFGGGGEGGVGSLILGNFIEEVDKQVSATEYLQVKGNAKTGITSSYVKIGGGIIEEVKKTAGIIGVDITYPGEGYTSEPFVRFEDNCDKGFGAYGRATIDKDPNSPTFGQITGVLMISEGLNYPADAPEDAFVEKIVVEDGGTGYKLTDEIEDFEICGVDNNGKITKVCTNDKAYRTTPAMQIKSTTGTGAILTPVMTRKRRLTGVINVIDCITPRNNIVGYVDGKEYNGPFHLHPDRGVKMVGAAHTSSAHAVIYNTPQESLRSGGTPRSNVGSTRINLRSIPQLIKESETQTETSSTETTTPSMDTYSDPVDESQNNTPPPTPPSSPPSSPPPSSPPSSGSSGGGYGY